MWKETVTLGTEDAPRKTADLYAEDAVLWGTVSEEVRETPEQIYDYFVSGCCLGLLGVNSVCFVCNPVVVVVVGGGGGGGSGSFW